MNKTYASRDEPGEQICCPIVELRQYTLHPGKRDVLIDLFDRKFIESQEAVGIKVIGQFRDLDDPDRFVWLRGFRDMPSRARALGSFYGGPVWKAHRDTANSTMIDSDNVLLLRPTFRSSGFSLENSVRPPPGAKDTPDGLITATLYYFDALDDDFIDFFERTLKPLFLDAGASVLASFITEDSPNNFPSLPIRAGEHVFIWFASFRDETAYKLYAATLVGLKAWSWKISNDLALRIKGPPQVLRLSPTRRSQLHG